MSRYFAEVNSNNMVVNVLVVDEKDCLNQDGAFDESVGAAFLQSLFGAKNFIETRIDGSIRRFYAHIEGKYLPELNEFRPRQPDPHWLWDDNLGEWIDPTEPEPTEE